MSSVLAAPVGQQLPRVSSAPRSVRTQGDDAVELAHIAGLDLDPWQQHVLRVSLGERPDGKWSAFEVGLLVPRQNGKGAILEARELAGLFLFGERLILHSAHELKTAIEAFLRIKQLIQETPELDAQVANFYQSNEKTAIELKNGQRLRFVARSSGSGRGFSADLAILDEAYNLPPETLAAILPTMSARPNPQLWYTSSAGMDSSEVLARVRERGTVGDKRLAFFDWSAPEGADPDDPEMWAVANPGLGIRIHPEFIEAERAALGDEEFARERLGIWNDPGKGAVIDPRVWVGCADAGSQVEDPVAFAVDVAPMGNAASISLAGRRSDGLFHVEVVRNQRGTDWLVPALQTLRERFAPCAIVLDRAGPAGSVILTLQEQGFDLLLTNSTQMAQACGGLFDAVVNGQLRHIDQPLLNTAVGSARKRSIGEAWGWHRKDVGQDITPLVSTTLALWGFQQSAARPRRKVSGPPRVIVMS